ncbi:MAG: ABC transporter ATP-binding protein [Candidatus Methanoperedens sp.]|nr:ABC transporter ATP-binding protein [Candidatus Methanoperedens sp.]MCE8425299.1 ABC transporter ATP-binding protein [Candidatus Methanoperedens sp.]MCE8427820.1 ABC transporter ATP-binding protein [Candidatus Methanoperedens sp.]
MQLFDLKNVNYLYLNRIHALNDISLSIEQGEHIAILGANGSGKSTLLKLLDGLIFPSSGIVKAFGKTLTENILDGEGGDFPRFFRKKVGLIFQNSEAQLFCPTVLDEIKFGPLQLDIAKTDINQRINDVMGMLNIENLKDRAPYTLSGGEKKKVAIASVLSINPDVLLLDEPTNGLDPRTQRWLVELLIELRKIGKTIIIATHDLEIVEEVSERAVVFNEDHRIVADGKAKVILNDTALLMGVNLIHEHSHRHIEKSKLTF